jgi:hypothetical protein
MGKAVQRVQLGWPVGRPLCGSLGGGLYEVRQDLSDNRTGRVLFCFSEKQRSCCSMRSSRRPRRSRKLRST